MTEPLDRLRAALADRYRVERELGSGGMATVYLADDLRHERQVAIKVLRPDLAATLGPERFLQEIRIAAKLHHPHILPLYDSGEAEGFLYYVMPYEAGQSLRDRLLKEKELPVHEALRLLRDVVDALAHAHEHGVVHRDIKPENILLSGQHALVTDFGVAKAVSEATGRQQLTTAGVALGTPAYMAPEQAAADPNIDQRADIYAVGVVAYELLTGRTPFLGATAQQVLSAHIAEPPEPVTKHRGSVPAACEQLVMRCLEKRPADRWQSAAELLPQLEAIVTPSGGITPSATAPVRAPRGGLRTMRVAAIAAVVAAAVLGGVWALTRERSNVVTDAQRMAVLPFMPAVGDSALTRLGRELAVLVSANLDGVGDIQTVDAAAVLSRISEAGATAGEGGALAAGLGAASVLRGDLVRVGDVVRAEAALLSTDGLETIARMSAAAPAGDVGGLADSLTWAVLDEVWRGRGAPTPRLVSGMTSSFQALRAFLEGEALVRQGLYVRAAEAYGRAIAADSSFWMAYGGLATASHWVGRSVPQQIGEAYWEHRDALPERDRLLLEANRAATFEEAHALRREVTRRYPDYIPAWWRYADPIIHDGGFFGYELTEALAGLERIVELNPRTVSAWDHIAIASLALRDSAASRRALDALEALNARPLIQEGYGWDMVVGLRTVHGLMFEGLDEEAAARALADVFQSVELVGWTVSNMKRMLLVFPPAFGVLHPRVGLALGRELRRRGVSGEELEDVRAVDHLLNSARGAWEAALGGAGALAMESGTQWRALQAYRLAGVGVWLGAVDRAEAGAHRDVAMATAQNMSDTVEVLWVDGLLTAAQQDRGGLRSTRERIAGHDVPGGALVTGVLQAFELDLGDERRIALAQLDSVVRVGSEAYESYAVYDPAVRLALSQWLLADGELNRAASVLRTVDVWKPWLWHLEASLTLRPLILLQHARIEEARGRAERARRYYMEFLDWYDTPDDRVRHLVDEAEAALLRLAGEEVGGG